MFFLQATPKLLLSLQLKIHAFLLWLSVGFLMHVRVLLISSKAKNLKQPFDNVGLMILPLVFVGANLLKSSTYKAI